jgi:hypothetical protein
MYHYTYLIENKINGKKYIGVRSCQIDPSTDFYWSSSKSLKNEINLIGRENFKKIILAIFDTRTEAVCNEIELHKFYDVGNNPKFYNRARQTSTGFDTTGTPSPLKGVAKTSAQKKKQSKIMKLKSNGKNNAMYGKTQSDKTKKLISEKLKGLLIGERNGRFGVTLSSDTKQKISIKNKGKRPTNETKKLISEKLKGLVVGKRNGQYGRIYSNEEKRARAENLKGINQGTKWFTNGIVIKRFLPGTEPPGFFLGKKILPK